MIRVQRRSADGKASYHASVTCDGCDVVVGAGEAPLQGSFLEHENAALASARFVARGNALRVGAAFVGDRDECAACAAKSGRTPRWQRAVLEWFEMARHHDKAGADPGIRFDAGEIEWCVRDGYLRACGTGWMITEAGTAALRHGDA